MCLLSVFPMPDLLDTKTAERLKNGAECNPHGSGWAVIQGDRIITGKDMDGEKAVYEFMEAYWDATGPALFHSRWATHGGRDLSNVHPFRVPVIGGNGDTYVAHNGIMPQESWPTIKDPRSDTRVFAEDILPDRFRKLDAGSNRNRLSKWLAGNKIAVLTTSPHYQRQLYLFGMGLGEWVDGVWYSNGDHAGWGRYYGYGQSTGTRSYGGPDERCVFCGSNSVNAWAICTACTTCQDCFETHENCQCFTPIQPDTVGGTPLAIEGKTYEPSEFGCVIGYDSATGREHATLNPDPDEEVAAELIAGDPAYAEVLAEIDRGDDAAGAQAALDEAQATVRPPAQIRPKFQKAGKK